MKRNTAYSVPQSVKEDIYDEVEPVSEYERNRAPPKPQARAATVTVGDKPHVSVKDSSTRKGFIAVALLITGALIFLLLITILSLVSVQSAAIMSEKQVACPELQHPGNGTVVLAGGRALELGSMASYSCDQDFALIGDMARFCVRAPSGYVTAGRWNGSIPKCQVPCHEIEQTEGGLTSTITSISNKKVFTYSCNFPGYVLVGPGSRECVYPTNGQQGEWSIDSPVTCAIGILIDCRKTSCRSTTVRCLDQQGHCKIECNDSSPYACHQAVFECPNDGNGCIVDCASNDRYACLESNTRCPLNGDCAVNCLGDYSCQYSNTTCSRNGHCMIDCDKQYSCQYARFISPEGGRLSLNCGAFYSCDRAVVSCQPTSNCAVICTGSSSCRYTTLSEVDELICSGSSSCRDTTLSEIDQLICSGSSSCRYTTLSEVDQLICSGSSSCRYATLSEVDQLICSDFSACDYAEVNAHSVNCSGSFSCDRVTLVCQSGTDCLSCSGSYSCDRANIDCPTTEKCDVDCTAVRSCSSAVINCHSGEVCEVNCSGESSCQSMTINCPENRECNIDCTGQNSCNNARITCPTGGLFRCNINCTNPLSCMSLRITNTQNVNLQCCGGRSCGGTTSVPPNSITQCTYV